MTEHERAYQRGTIRVHWISAMLILFLIGIGLWMVELDLASEGRRLATRAHVVAGLVCMFLTVVRIVFRIRNTAPPPLEMSRSHLVAVRVVHGLQYVTLVGLLASGLGLVLSAGLWTTLAGGAPLPDMGELVPRAAHGVLAKVFIALLVAHIGGSVLNQIQGGGTFHRMGLPRKKSA